MIVRRLIVVAVALLLAVQSVRNAAVAELSTLHPTSAAKLWAGHPAVEVSLGLAEIGNASREHRPIDGKTFALVDDAAAKAPLSPSPYLVRGVQEQTAGDAEVAKRAFLAAQWRDPRSLPAAYFLADHYFRVGDTLNGLQQTAVLARLSPSGLEAVAPYIAAYARDPANWPKMRILFRTQQGLQNGVLVALAQDARNARAILTLADAEHRKPDSDWLPILIRKMVASGDYHGARAIWSSVGGAHAGNEAVFDSKFSTPGPPPPFNWSLASSTTGLAERQPGGRLHVIFYGNDDGVLASQLLLLPPGQYRLQMQLVGAPVHSETLRWSVRCDQASDSLGGAGIDDVVSNGWTFQIPANCPAQWIELSGRSGDIAQQSEVTIANFSLRNVDNRG